MSDNKVLTIPVCWALYEVPANVFELLGNQVDRPNLIVIEAMVEQGLARRVKLISSTIHDEFEEPSDEGEEETEEEKPKDSPWYPKE